MSIDSNGLSWVSTLTKSESFQNNITIDTLCKDGGIINKPVVSILGNLWGLLMFWGAYCSIPKKYKIPLLVVYGLLLILPIYDIIQMFTLNNKQMEEKCKGLITGKIRASGLFVLYNFVNMIVGVIIWIAVIYFLIRLIFYKENLCKRK